jgi:signal transduction histidine kinase/DNA-binding response OmpR family regulator
MNHKVERSYEERVLLLAPTARDAELAGAVLAEAGLTCLACADLETLCRALKDGAGAILLTEDVLLADESQCLVEALRRQPEWSDVPVLLLTNSGADSAAVIEAMELLGNITLLERPVRLTSLVSAARTALKARRRQYQLRKQLADIRRQNERLQLLCEVAAVLLSTNDPDAMLQALFNQVRGHLVLDVYFNFLVAESGDVLRLASCAGVAEETARSIRRIEFGQGICGTVAVHRRPIVATYIQQSDDPMAQLVKGFGIRSYACNPLLFGDRLLGTLSFASRQRDEFTADELDFLQLISQYVTVAYERLRLIDQLREADQRKDEFLATLAHELRNPLAPIRNGLQIMKLSPAGSAIAPVREIMERQMEQLVRLVDDLLDLSRITRGKIELRREPLDLAAVIDEALEVSRPLVEAARHELTVTLPPEPLRVEGDLTRLAQVVSNLVNNAAKYTPEGGHIAVGVIREGDTAVLQVSDDGIGIPADMLSRVWEIFAQVDHHLERAQGGLGIGLSLVKRLVEMHGGRVEAKSAGPGRGSCFSVRLPLAPKQAKPHERNGHSNGEQTDGKPGQLRILVVDDNVDGARSLAMLLRLGGNEVRVAHDGPSALEAAAEFRPSAVLLDIGLPGMNGYEVARRMRGMPQLKRTVLIAQTGWGQDSDRRRSQEAGFNAHLVKPVDLGELQSLLEGLPV